MYDFFLVVSGKGRELVVETRLFGLLGEDTAIIPTTDTEMLRQYQSLLNKYDDREETYDSPQNKLILDNLINGEDRGSFEAGTLIRRLSKKFARSGESLMSRWMI